MEYSGADACYIVTVDTAIFTLHKRDLKVCLVRRDADPDAGAWMLPSLSPNPIEGLDDTAQRCIYDIIGRRDDGEEGEPFFQQLYTFGTPNRDPRRRVISVAYFALVSKDRLPPDSLTTTDRLHVWHNAYHPPTLAFDHAEILSTALTRLRYKIEYSAVAFQLMPDEFTLRELQDAYTVILNDEKLDKANFRKKIREANIVEPISRFRETGGRPAKLFRFRKDAKLEIKTRRFFP